MLRRNALLGLLGTPLLTPGIAQAQESFPNRPVRLVYPFAAGQTGDIYWRQLAAQLSKLWNQPVIVENKPGAGGIIATEYVLNAPPDGYTLLITGVSTLGLGVFNKISFDPQKDLRLVALAYNADVVVTTNSHVPARNYAEFVAYAKANPGKMNYASLGKNSIMMYLEWFQRAAGIKLAEVPYKGTPDQIQAMLSNDVQLMYIQARPIKQHIDAGRLRPLFVVSRERLPDMPNVPTNFEVGLPDYRPPQWSGIMGSQKLPDAVVQKIRADVARITASGELDAVLFQQGNRAFKGTPREADELFEYSGKVLAQLARDLNLKPD